MKPKFQLALICLFTVLSHYFVLNFFGVQSDYDLKGVVISSEILGKGLYRRAEITVAVNRFHNGILKRERRVYSIWDKKVPELKPGSAYEMKTQSDWLVKYKLSSL